MSESDRHVWTKAERDAVEGHYRAIAQLLLEKRCWGGKAAGWRVEIDGCVFKFSAVGYPKHGTELWRQREGQTEAAVAEFEAQQRSGVL